MYSAPAVEAAATLAVDYTPPRVTMQERVAQQAHDRNILRFNARRAYPDGVTIPACILATTTQNKPNTNEKRFMKDRLSGGHSVEDDASLGGWSGGTGFGASVGSFGVSSPMMEKASQKPAFRKTGRRSKSASGRHRGTRSRGTKQTLGRSTAPSVSGRMESSEEQEEVASLTGSLTIRDHPISRRASPDTNTHPL